MKTKFFTLLLLLFLGVGTQVQAQTTDFSIQYDVEVSGDEIEPMVAAMMAGTTMELSFKGSKSRMVMDMGMLSKTVAVTDGEAKKGVVLMDMMGRKMAIPMTEEDFQPDADAPEPKIRKTGKTKKIAGYNCKQAFIEAEEGQEFEIWYSEDIRVEAESEYNYSGLNGFPLQMDVNQEGMMMKMTAKEVSKGKLSKDLFSTEIPDGYDITNPAELGNGY